MQCKICSEQSYQLFIERVLNKYDVKYFQCSKCFFIQTEEPYWLDDAYRSPINIEDTGLVDRNIILAKRTASIIYFLFNKHGKFLDYAAGYGLFVRLMRDYGFDFYWSDIYTQNIFARGFEFDLLVDKKIELATAFECFEHFANPLAEIDKIHTLSKNILFSTEIFDRNAPSLDWDYYGFSHGQHVSFYSIQSLIFIADRLGANLITNGKSFHLFTPKKINQTLFNYIIKISLLGFPLIIKKTMGTKMLLDSHLMRKIK
jgi:hypothetical protein